jgi:hypothetical protein
MNRNDFLNMIEDRVPVSRQTIGEVYELIDIFPYFQSAHLLLLKGLKNTADVKFENQLKNSAIYIADREVLYWQLKTKPFSEAEPVVEYVDVSDAKIRNISSSDEVTGDTQQTVIEYAKNSEQMISEIEKDSGETRTDEQQEDSIEGQGHSILISAGANEEESAGVMLLLDEDTSPYEEKIFYMDPGFSVPDKGDLLELDLDENVEDGSDEGTFNTEQSEKGTTDSKKNLQSELIDKFIIANPRIEPVKERTHLEIEDISKPFINGEGGFVTETLAKIYINQGYYSKAIDIYEKLSLKFPEKSSYFASQIEKVKEYIKK